MIIIQDLFSETKQQQVKLGHRRQLNSRKNSDKFNTEERKGNRKSGGGGGGRSGHLRISPRRRLPVLASDRCDAPRHRPRRRLPGGLAAGRAAACRCLPPT
uniref:Uncharacterized protein n=1 Tax=Oryza rufipogon TaxID=4529 RepID=A0A0E0PVR0_ORYRU